MLTILYFARLAEQLACSRELVALPEPALLSELKQQLQARGEPWRSVLADQRVLMAVNQCLVNEQASLAAGDEVAFFPPVTGG